MAYSLRKKVAIRAQRLIDDLAKLRTEHPNTHAEMADLNACITEAQRMADRWRDMFGSKPAARPAPAPRPASTAPAPYSGPLAAPVYGPSTGITEAKHKGSQHWAVKGVVQDHQDDNDDGLNFIPVANTTAEYVQQCLDGLITPTLCEAAQALQAEGGAWLQMTPEQQVDAINVRARQIEEDDPDGSKALGRAAGAAAAPDADDQDDGTRF